MFKVDAGSINLISETTTKEVNLMAICEQCGKEYDGSFGSGRFCSRSCSNKWVALNQSDEAKAKKVAKGKCNLKHDGTVGFCSQGYWTPENREKHSVLMKDIMSDENVRTRLSESLKNKYLSEEYRKKISDSMILAVAEGRHKGFQYSRNPYSEEYVKCILDKEDITYECQYKFNYIDDESRYRSYFLDFYLKDLNVDLEVDGSFHYREPQLSMDRLRDSIVSRTMTIFRFKWSPVGTEELDSEVSRLLSFLKSADVV